MISRQGTKAAYHCLVSWTADNGEWRNGSEKDTDGEGVKNTVWLEGMAGTAKPASILQGP